MRKIYSLFIAFGFLNVSSFFVPAAAAQTQINIPAVPIPGSESFGRQVAVLPNGNFVVTDPGYDAGAITDAGRVYLYNGATLALISTMTGSAMSDSVGSNFSGRGITVLTGGDYVVSSSNWNGGRGAVTRCSQTTGCPAAISSGNSLVGSAADNFVGGSGVTALPSGNYVVRSPNWDDGTTNEVGAITWCSGTTACVGAVSAANSRVGSTVGDQIGLINIVILSNGNYVSQDLFWDNAAAVDAGAVTFCTGTAICSGVVSASNSLIGTTANEYTGNQGIYPLTNGNFVVANDLWDNGAATDAGAATFCSGTIGCAAAVSQANSLVGTATDDHVSLNGVAALSNGNYVVRSSIWDNGGTADAGAATFCNGGIGCVNTTVSTANSLHGSTANDGVGNGVISLTNNNYVVASTKWDNTAAAEPNAGASTWCNGTTGCVGAVTPANSLIGDLAGTEVGFAVALTNGNYVVATQNWANPMNFAGQAGAVTFCNGAAGCVGEITTANSLYGSTFQDFVGNVTPLTNGNYVVTSGLWDNGAVSNVGAATFCSGTAGCTGAVSPANSLIGTTASNAVGGSGATALVGGNYVVNSGAWDNGATMDVGAVTRCSGTTGCVGTVSAANSLIGSTASDLVGAVAFGGTTALPNGGFIARSQMWDNAGITDAGAVSYGFGSGGTVGALASSNSVRGTTAFGGSEQNFSFGAINNQLVVGRPADNIVTVFRPGAPPTAAMVAVGGRVVKFKGRGILNARVTLIDSGGNSRAALTNSFGYYRFADVPAGATYTFTVTAKNQTFDQPAQVRSIVEDTDDVDFAADNPDGVLNVFRR